MNDINISSFIRPVIIIIVVLVIGYIRAKLSKPKVEGSEQKPGILQKIGLGVLFTITIVFILMAILGIMMNEFEMAIVSFILAIIMIALSMYMKFALKTSYQENTEYLILRTRNKEQKVFYKDIVDWKTSLNEIILFDRSKLNEKPIKINIVFFKPEILLRTIADMTFEGKFQNVNANSIINRNREKEIVNFLASNNYRYLVEDYIEQTKRDKKKF